MKATVRGCRGSLASPGAQTLHFGGNTSCIEVWLDDGTLIVLDAGTGIRELGLTLATGAPRTIHLLLTHLHLDHLEGLGFFLPLWRADTELHIWGPPSPPLFPVLIRDAPAELHFHDVPDEPWTIGSATISAQHVVHPGPTVGYRVEADGSVIAYLPDHEPALGGPLVDGRSDWISGLDVAAGADVLLHDAQYSEDEYREHIGWGHSSVADAVAFARVAGARRLLLFHHDPLHSDAGLRLLQLRARELWPDADVPPEMAVEGAELELRDHERLAANRTRV